ncbi:hypothetical protein BA177_01990 [Woeseia oceani]|uniref:Uncharacterized protein n=1 Tax=Woeseia oceani TaxID=1548547 RepID=A0A193LC89_9GAMM|nr:hypothetical protein BA177_01990 [Woeseia oceani]
MRKRSRSFSRCLPPATPAVGSQTLATDRAQQACEFALRAKQPELARGSDWTPDRIRPVNTLSRSLVHGTPQRAAADDPAAAPGLCTTADNA